MAPETIYYSLYFQARGGLKREVQAALRSGRSVRPKWMTVPCRGIGRATSLPVP